MGARLSRSDLLVGARFGQHAIVRPIGHGRSASVYEPRHVALGRLDALKVLHEHLAASPTISARFVRQARIAAQLRHPHGIAQQARYDATHVFHRMYDGAAVEDIPARLTRFESQYMDFGRTDSTLEGAGRIVARLHDVPAYVAPWITTMKAA